MNIFKQLIVSLYSPKDISSFIKQRMSKTIFYVLLLTLISLLPTFYLFNTSIINEMGDLQETIKNLPSFVIEDGDLVSDETAPITINQNDLTVIFDSTGTVTSDDAKASSNSIHLLKNEVVYTMAGQSQTIPYTLLTDMTLTKEDLIELISSMNSLLPIILPLTSVAIYLFSSISKCIGVSFLALIGLALKNMMKSDLTYGQLWRLSAYSVTLPTIFFMIMEALKTFVPNGFFIYWLVAIIMLILVIKEISSSQQTNSLE